MQTVSVTVPVTVEQYHENTHVADADMLMSALNCSSMTDGNHNMNRLGPQRAVEYPCTLQA